jgi:SOS-response transcriptional repressor LexA
MPNIQQYTNQRRAERDIIASRVLAFIKGYMAQQGISPSMNEIAAACYLSRSNVARYLDLLEAWGHIARKPGVPRSISLLDPNARNRKD